MSKIDDAIRDLKNETARTRRKGYSHASVGLLELEALIEWAEKVRRGNPFLVGDRVKLEVDPESEEDDEPTEGVVVGFGGGRSVIVDSGEFKHLWYSFDSVERVED